MAIERIIPKAVPGPRSDYALVSIVDAGQSMAYVSGQTGRRADGSIDLLPFAQATAAFENLESLLSAVNSSPSDIVHTRTYLVGRDPLDDFIAARHAVFAAWFGSLNPPTSTLAIVSALADPDALIEIEAVAVVSGDTFDNPVKTK